MQTALVNLRTAKIHLLMLLNDRTPVEQFDVSGPFDFTEQISPLEEFRKMAMDTAAGSQGRCRSYRQSQDRSPAGGSQWFHRSDLRHGLRAQSSHPRLSLGVNVNIPLRIFDRNQGEKVKTQLDITHNERLRDANVAQVFNDVDSAYATLEQQSDFAASL